MLELEVSDVRRLEDLLIETIYAGLLRCKLDQRARTVRVLETTGRDVRVEKIDELIQSLSTLQKSAEYLYSCIQNSSNILSDQRNCDKQDEIILQDQLNDAKAVIKVIFYS